jgi:hypothetical protein
MLMNDAPQFKIFSNVSIPVKFVRMVEGKKLSLQIKETLFAITYGLNPILNRTTTPWTTVYNGQGHGKSR